MWLKFHFFIHVYVFAKGFNSLFFFLFLANWLRRWSSSYDSDTSYYCGTSRNHRAQTPPCFKYSFPVPRSRLERVIRGKCLFLVFLFFFFFFSLILKIFFFFFFFLLTLFFCLFINQIFKGYYNWCPAAKIFNSLIQILNRSW